MDFKKLSKIADSLKRVNDSKVVNNDADFDALIKDWTDDSEVSFKYKGHNIKLVSETWEEDEETVYSRQIIIDGEVADDLVETDSIPAPDLEEIDQRIGDSKKHKKG